MPKKPDLAKRELWQSRLQEFERGNTTIVEFCRRMSVPVWSFYYWQQKLRLETITDASGEARNETIKPTRRRRFVHRARRTGPVKFVPIQITGQLNVEVQLPNGTRVTVPCQDHGAIGAVIAALVSEPLERRPC